MVINKRWNIGDSEYLLSQNLNQNKIRVHINSVNYTDKDAITLFYAYNFIFEELGNFRLSTVDGLIHIVIKDSAWECDINILNYSFTVLDKNDGECVHKATCHNLYECFDEFLCMLEEE